jgi:hypothetical protein
MGVVEGNNKLGKATLLKMERKKVTRSKVKSTPLISRTRRVKNQRRRFSS